MKYILFFMAGFSSLSKLAAQNKFTFIDYTISEGNGINQPEFITHLSVKKTDSVVKISPDPCIGDVVNPFDCKVTVMKKVNNRFIKMSGGLTAECSEKSLVVVKEGVIQDTFSLKFRYFLKRGNYKIKAERKVYINDYYYYIKTGWLYFKLESDSQW